MKNARRVTVKRIVSARYSDGIGRPLSWDERRAGIDVIETCQGETISLMSTGQQSVPQIGWVILLNPAPNNPETAPVYTWTLFGIPKLIGNASASLSELTSEF